FLMGQLQTLLGNKKEADRLLTIYAKNADQYLNWYLNGSSKPLAMSAYSCSKYVRNLIEAVQGFEDTGNTKLAAHYGKLLDDYYRRIVEQGVILDL
ncbi:MAG: hypothetical protein ACI4TS_00335, partial [Bacteroidaceae bacterium]